MTGTASEQAESVTYVSPQMRASVGHELDRRVSYPVAASDIRKWAVAVHHPELPPSRFWDAPEVELTAPEDFNPFAWLVADPAGPPLVLRDPEELLGIAGPQVRTRLRGGMSVEYGPAAIRTGDVITSVRSLAGYEEREGRRGPMLFTTIGDVWTNQHGELIKTFQFTFIRL